MEFQIPLMTLKLIESKYSLQMFEFYSNVFFFSLAGDVINLEVRVVFFPNLKFLQIWFVLVFVRVCTGQITKS